ncbi:hypothetical protein [Cellulosimicrobium protaetiae]|uniref:Lipoprotein n=1 Tax=Cellulosimicrobium protaetiae TaxID=2587808 RepID=A0A6M5UMK7_9MICO|nr:hypothetical protein [Cellulosimicrobium protaetiae]QJW38692.1 hypothetical protein FIC82_020095 [Cellulosimicrobium protaetiae]
MSRAEDGRSARAHVVAATLGALALTILGGCGANEAPAAQSPSDPACTQASGEQVDQITATFIAPVDVVAAYSVTSTEHDDLVFVTVGTDGFPDEVSHKSGEFAGPTYAYSAGELLAASGQASRYSPDLPSLSDSGDRSVVYDDAASDSFNCVRDALG